MPWFWFVLLLSNYFYIRFSIASPCESIQVLSQDENGEQIVSFDEDCQFTSGIQPYETMHVVINATITISQHVQINAKSLIVGTNGIVKGTCEDPTVTPEESMPDCRNKRCPGASHGGLSGPEGHAHGDAWWPRACGQLGVSSYLSTLGGAALFIQTEKNIILHGKLQMTGRDGSAFMPAGSIALEYAPGGAGGSILLVAEMIELYDDARIEAQGGAAINRASGGGGGRIAVYTKNATITHLSQLEQYFAVDGQVIPSVPEYSGGPGTVMWHCADCPPSLQSIGFSKHNGPAGIEHAWWVGAGYPWMSVWQGSAGNVPQSVWDHISMDKSFVFDSMTNTTTLHQLYLLNNASASFNLRPADSSEQLILGSLYMSDGHTSSIHILEGSDVNIVTAQKIQDLDDPATLLLPWFSRESYLSNCANSTIQTTGTQPMLEQFSIYTYITLNETVYFPGSLIIEMGAVLHLPMNAIFSHGYSRIEGILLGAKNVIWHDLASFSVTGSSMWISSCEEIGVCGGYMRMDHRIDSEGNKAYFQPSDPGSVQFMDALISDGAYVTFSDLSTFHVNEINIEFPESTLHLNGDTKATVDSITVRNLSTFTLQSNVDFTIGLNGDIQESIVWIIDSTLHALNIFELETSDIYVRGLGALYLADTANIVRSAFKGVGGGPSIDGPGTAENMQKRNMAFGGSYGGFGAIERSAVYGSVMAGTRGTPYGDLKQPNQPGSRGQAGTAISGELEVSGNGGGALILHCNGTLRLVRTLIQMDGTSAPFTSKGGCGSGGSIWIQTHTLEGSAIVLSADGASGKESDGSRLLQGSGGGGRISVQAEIIDPLLISGHPWESAEFSIHAYGGFATNNWAAPGTIYLNIPTYEETLIIAHRDPPPEESEDDQFPTHLPTWVYVNESSNIDLNEMAVSLHLKQVFIRNKAILHFVRPQPESDAPSLSCVSEQSLRQALSQPNFVSLHTNCKLTIVIDTLLSKSSVPGILRVLPMTSMTIGGQSIVSSEFADLDIKSQTSNQRQYVTVLDVSIHVFPLAYLNVSSIVNQGMSDTVLTHASFQLEGFIQGLHNIFLAENSTLVMNGSYVCTNSATESLFTGFGSVTFGSLQATNQSSICINLPSKKELNMQNLSAKDRSTILFDGPETFQIANTLSLDSGSTLTVNNTQNLLIEGDFFMGPSTRSKLFASDSQNIDIYMSVGKSCRFDTSTFLELDSSLYNTRRASFEFVGRLSLSCHHFSMDFLSNLNGNGGGYGLGYPFGYRMEPTGPLAFSVGAAHAGFGGNSRKLYESSMPEIPAYTLPYDNGMDPICMGEGGMSSNEQYGHGGAALILDVYDTFELNGTIQMNGNPGFHPALSLYTPGGAGGAINVLVRGQILPSTGILEAKGGRPGGSLIIPQSDMAGGSGGMISIRTSCNANQQFDESINIPSYSNTAWETEPSFEHVFIVRGIRMGAQPGGLANGLANSAPQTYGAAGTVFVSCLNDSQIDSIEYPRRPNVTLTHIRNVANEMMVVTGTNEITKGLKVFSETVLPLHEFAGSFMEQLDVSENKDFPLQNLTHNDDWVQINDTSGTFPAALSKLGILGPANVSLSWAHTYSQHASENTLVMVQSMPDSVEYDGIAYLGNIFGDTLQQGSLYVSTGLTLVLGVEIYTEPTKYTPVQSTVNDTRAAAWQSLGVMYDNFDEQFMHTLFVYAVRTRMVELKSDEMILSNLFVEIRPGAFLVLGSKMKNATSFMTVAKDFELSISGQFLGSTFAYQSGDVQISGHYATFKVDNLHISEHSKFKIDLPELGTSSSILSLDRLHLGKVGLYTDSTFKTNLVSMNLHSIISSNSGMFLTQSNLFLQDKLQIFQSTLNTNPNVSIHANGGCFFQQGTTSQLNGLTTFNCSEIIVDALSVLSADGGGYGAQTTIRGTSVNDYYSSIGGSHGGRGMNIQQTNEAILFAPYGDFRLTNPGPTFGGGGTLQPSSADGGKGGGAIHIIARDTAIINGNITANGQTSVAYTSSVRYGGCGAGGSVRFDVGVLLASNGLIQANGGKAAMGSQVYHAYPGGGGRIAFYCKCDADESISTNQLKFCAIGDLLQFGGISYISGAGSVYKQCGTHHTLSFSNPFEILPDRVIFDSSLYLYESMEDNDIPTITNLEIDIGSATLQIEPDTSATNPVDVFVGSFRSLRPGSTVKIHKGVNIHFGVGNDTHLIDILPSVTKFVSSNERMIIHRERISTHEMHWVNASLVIVGRIYFPPNLYLCMDPTSYDGQIRTEQDGFLAGVLNITQCPLEVGRLGSVAISGCRETENENYCSFATIDDPNACVPNIPALIESGQTACTIHAFASNWDPVLAQLDVYQQLPQMCIVPNNLRSGCTIPSASNYIGAADIDTGECIFLPASANECSDTSNESICPNNCVEATNFYNVQSELLKCKADLSQLSNRPPCDICSVCQDGFARTVEGECVENCPNGTEPIQIWDAQLGQNIEICQDKPCLQTSVQYVLRKTHLNYANAPNSSSIYLDIPSTYTSTNPLVVYMLDDFVAGPIVDMGMTDMLEDTVSNHLHNLTVVKTLVNSSIQFTTEWSITVSPSTVLPTVASLLQEYFFLDQVHDANSTVQDMDVVRRLELKRSSTTKLISELSQQTQLQWYRSPLLMTLQVVFSISSEVDGCRALSTNISSHDIVFVLKALPRQPVFEGLTPTAILPVQVSEQWQVLPTFVVRDATPVDGKLNLISFITTNIAKEAFSMDVSFSASQSSANVNLLIAQPNYLLLADRNSSICFNVTTVYHKASSACVALSILSQDNTAETGPRIVPDSIELVCRPHSSDEDSDTTASSTQFVVFTSSSQAEWIIRVVESPIPAWLQLSQLSGTGTQALTVSVICDQLNTWDESPSYTLSVEQISPDIDLAQRIAQMKIQTNIKYPRIGIYPNVINDVVAPGSGLDLPIRIENKGDAPLIFSAPTYSESVSWLQIATTGAINPIELQPRETRSFIVHVNTSSLMQYSNTSATIVGQVIRTNISVTSNDPTAAQFLLPVNIKISQVQLCPDNLLQLRLSPQEIREATITVNNIAPRNLYLAADVGEVNGLSSESLDTILKFLRVPEMLPRAGKPEPIIFTIEYIADLAQLGPTVRIPLQVRIASNPINEPNLIEGLELREIMLEVNLLPGAASVVQSFIEIQHEQYAANEVVQAVVNVRDRFGIPTDLAAPGVFEEGGIPFSWLAKNSATDSEFHTDGTYIASGAVRQRVMNEGVQPLQGIYDLQLALQQFVGMLSLSVQFGNLNIRNSPMFVQILPAVCFDGLVRTSDGSACVCQAGHYQVGSVCQICSAGTIKPNPSNTSECIPCGNSQFSLAGATECRACPEEGAVCSDGIITFLDGYWMESSMNDTMLLLHRCPNPKACQRTQMRSPISSQGRQLETMQPTTCADGYQDILCAACEDKYAKWHGFSCNQCWPDAVSWFVSILALLLFIVLVLVLAVKRTSGERNDGSATEFSAVARICINWLQASAVLATFRVASAPTVQDLLGSGDAADGLALGFFPLECATGMRYVGRLILYLVLPPLLLMFVAISLFIRELRKAQRANNTTKSVKTTNSADAKTAQTKTDDTTITTTTTSPSRSDENGLNKENQLPNIAELRPNGSTQSNDTSHHRSRQHEGTSAVHKQRRMISCARISCKNIDSQIVKACWDYSTNRLKSAAVVVLFLLHHSISRTIFSGFTTFDLTQRHKKVFLSDVTLDTLDPQYKLIVGLAVVGLLLYALGIPILAGAFLFRNFRKGKLTQAKFRSKYGFLYDGYTLDSNGKYLWEVVVSIRKLAVAGIATFAYGHAEVQALLSIAILVAFLALTIHYRPFMFRNANTLEISSLVVLFATQLLNLLYYFTQSFATIVFVFLINLSLLLAFVVILFGLWKSAYGKHTRLILAKVTKMKSTRLNLSNSRGTEYINELAHTTKYNRNNGVTPCLSENNSDTVPNRNRRSSAVDASVLTNPMHISSAMDSSEDVKHNEFGKVSFGPSISRFTGNQARRNSKHKDSPQ